MFDRVFKGVPANLREKLEKQLEQSVTLIVQNTTNAIHGTTIPDFTLQVLCGKLHSIFSMASEFNYDASRIISQGTPKKE